MGDRTIRIHMPRLGMGLPAKTVRPFQRRGDALLDGFVAALGEPADSVEVTGDLFDRPAPPAHLVDRVVRPLESLVRSGVSVSVPAGVPRALLFLAAGIRLRDGPAPNGTPEFWMDGRYDFEVDCRVEPRQVEVPRVRRAKVDVTGLPAADALRRIRQRLARSRDARFVQLTLTGETAEREVLDFGPRELQHVLPGGVQGSVSNETVSLCPSEDCAMDDEARRLALAGARAGLPELPETTGIYEFRDEAGRALYVGKAVNLRRRVASHYTAEAREPSPRGPMLLAARTVRYVELGSEVEALIAESARIREARPPYNRQMRETEGYRYLRADLDAEVPTLNSVVRARRDGPLYFGPFPKRWMLERALRVLMVVYGLRSCDWQPGASAPPVCTDRDLGICSAPCLGRVGAAEYRDRVRMALDRIMGKGAGEPGFGSLNAPSAGLLGTEDLRIFHGFLRTSRWFLEALRDANGLVPLADGRHLLVLGGLRAGVRDFGADGEEKAARWGERRVRTFLERPFRTWVRPDQADEVRILSSALRRASRPAGDCGTDSAHEDPLDP